MTPLLRAMAILHIVILTLSIVTHATAIATHQRASGARRQEPHLFMEVAGRGVPAASPQEVSPGWASQSFGFHNDMGTPTAAYATGTPDGQAAPTFLNGMLSEQTMPAVRNDFNNAGFSEMQSMPNQQAPEQSFGFHQNYVSKYLNLARHQKDRGQEELLKKAKEEDEAKQKAMDDEERARLDAEDKKRRMVQEDARRREAELEWKEEDDDQEDDDEDEPHVDWAHEDRLRGWGRQGWSQPKPVGLSHHHVSSTQPPTLLADKNELQPDPKRPPPPGVASGSQMLSQASKGTGHVVLSESHLNPDLPLLQTADVTLKK